MTEVPTEPQDIVRSFLLAIEAGDLDAALALLAPDAIWINVSLPALRGRPTIERTLRLLMRVGGGFRVHFNAIAADGDTVLTDRIDAMTFGRLEHRFWVTGRFEVRDGRIRLWRDAFDWGHTLVGLARAIAGLISPRLNRPWPASPDER